jgi:hypothetical protein
MDREVGAYLITQLDIFNSSSLCTGAGIAQWYSAGLRTGWSEVRVPVGARNFSHTTATRSALGPTQPPIQWIPRALSPRREADHSPPSNAASQ